MFKFSIFYQKKPDSWRGRYTSYKIILLLFKHHWNKKSLALSLICLILEFNNFIDSWSSIRPFMCKSICRDQKTSLIFSKSKLWRKPVSVTEWLGCTTAGSGVLEPNIHCFCPGNTLSETIPVITRLLVVMRWQQFWEKQWQYIWKCPVCHNFLEISFLLLVSCGSFWPSPADRSHTWWSGREGGWVREPGWCLPAMRKSHK